jgi:hypothetical protein
MWKECKSTLHTLLDLLTCPCLQVQAQQGRWPPLSKTFRPQNNQYSEETAENGRRTSGEDILKVNVKKTGTAEGGNGKVKK